MDNIWKISDKKPSLNKDDVHIWRMDLDRPTSEIEKGWQILSPEEKTRANRFVQSGRRQRFVASHAAFHAILATYLRELKGQIRFRYNSYGKPYLKNNPALRFNLSDSRSFALCAVAWNREIGIDIEFMKSDICAERIAERFFSPQESQALKALPPEKQLEGFYQMWTLKEAYIKGNGLGLSFFFQRFAIDIKAKKEALLWVDCDPSAPVEWALFPISSAKGYKAALAAQGPLKAIHYFEWC